MAFFATTSVFGYKLSRRIAAFAYTALILLCVVVYGGLSQLIAAKDTASLPQVGALQTAAKHISADTSTDTSAAAQAAAASTSTPLTSSTPKQSENCTPATYALPSSLNLANSPAGLNEIIEPTQTYGIHGTNGTELRQQIQACAPRQHASDSAAEYTAQTGYNLSWQYSYAQRADGNCIVTNARVGLHIAMILPTWEPSDSEDTAFAASWQSFLNGLTTHENGHITLDRQYANAMLADLQNFPASPCGTIVQSVNAVMQQSVLSLNVANQQYDDDTSHGATQGAIIPR